MHWLTSKAGHMRRRLTIALGLLAVPSSASADDFSVKIEPGIAIPLSAPQSSIFDVGGGQSVKALFAVAPWLDVGPTGSFTFLSAEEEGAESGVVWGLGVGLRLKRSHRAVSYRGVSPWFDADALYLRTGDLDRPGFDAAIGLAFPVGAARAYWIGPFVRYQQTVQLAREGYDNRDAKILTLGISFEVGAPIARGPVAMVEEVPEPEPEPEVVAAVTACPDSDRDTIPDNIDHCPDVAGEMDSWGCPRYEKVIVQRDMLQLKEKLYFEWDRAVIEPESHAVLDDVVQALQDNPGFRVQVEGHSDSTGGEAHNQTLSEARAAAVLDYLVAHGVAADRLVSKGLSSSEPLDTNATAAGRENNRRVEFVVNFILLNDGNQ